MEATATKTKTTAVRRPKGSNLLEELRELTRSIQELRESQKESDQRFRESLAESQKKFEREMKESKKYWDERYGSLHNNLGYLVEAMMTPQLYIKFRSLGYSFNRGARDYEVLDKHSGKTLAEIDVLLENGIYAMLVEAKIKPTTDDLTHHIRRIEILRTDANERGDSRKLLGAIAAPHFPHEVLTAAWFAGLFVIVPSEDAVDIVVPSGFKPREW